MKKNVRMVAGLCLLLMFTLFLTGCISIEMKVNKNGSCDLKYEIRIEGMGIDAGEVKDQLETSIDEANKYAGKKVVKLKSFKEKDGVITANISATNISDMDDGAFFGKLSDFKKEFPDELGNLKEAKTDKNIEKNAIKGASKLNVVRASGIASGGELSEFKVILPGAVKYVSTNVALIDNNTVRINGGYGVIIYQRSGGAGWLAYVLAIALIVVVSMAVIKNKGKNKASTATTAAPIFGAAPAAPSAPAAPGTPAAPSATMAADNTNVIHCPHCGTKLKIGAVFCSACGGRVSQ